MHLELKHMYSLLVPSRGHLRSGRNESTENSYLTDTKAVVPC